MNEHEMKSQLPEDQNFILPEKEKRVSGLKRFWLFFPRWLRIIFLTIFTLVLAVSVVLFSAWWYLNPSVERTDGIVYGYRNEKPLMIDVIRPTNPNGYGVAFMVSGGWKSGKSGDAPVWMMAPLIRRGYTVFAIYHISQPEATVQELIQDIHRGVRYVRYHAKEYGIDPDHIGASGGSAGGHLSLMVAADGGPGLEESDDPVDHVSSKVQAAAIFFPVTDLLNLGSSRENLGDGGPPKSFRNSFGPEEETLKNWQEIGRECSPIYHITEDLPPILIYHGDADTLTPLEQSEWFRDKALEKGAEVKLVVHPGGDHGWWSMVFDTMNFADWFDQHLRKSD